MSQLLKATVFVFLGVFLSCSNSGKTNTANVNRTDAPAGQWTILLQGVQCGVRQPSQVLIRTSEEWNAEWKRAFPGMDLPPDVPEVDFSKSWVVAAYMGEKNKGGFEVNIASVQPGTEACVVNIRHIAPGPGCMSSMAIEYPFVFVEIARIPDLRVEFKVTDELKACN